MFAGLTYSCSGILGRAAALLQQRIPASCRAFDGALLCSLGWEGTHMVERVQCAPVKFSANGNSHSLQYMEEFGARIAMVSLSLTFGSHHFSAIWLTLQLRPMPRHLSLATTLLLHDGGCLRWVRLKSPYAYTNDGSLASAGVKLYSAPPCRAMYV
jgi:hypothetical protein